MLSSVEQAFVGREEIRAPLKTPEWEARLCSENASVSVFFCFRVCMPKGGHGENWG